jgi:tetratricopeptide (TPR) repeat protein
VAADVRAEDAAVSAIAWPSGGETPEEVIARVTATADPEARANRLTGRALWTAALVERLADEATKLTRIDLDRAERAAAAADWIAVGIGDEGARARSLRALGHVRGLRRQYRDALDCYGQARALALKTGRLLDAAITMSGALQTLIYVSDYDTAHVWAGEARRILTAQEDTLRLARLDSNHGNVFFRQDRFGEALTRYERAREAFDRLGATEDAAVALRNLAACYISLGDFPRALRAYRRARRYCLQHGMGLMLVKADYNIAYLAFLRGEYARAIAAYRAVRESARVVGDTYHMALCDMDLAEVYLEINLYDKASRFAQRAREQFETLGMRYERGKSSAFLALAISHSGDISRALPIFRNARGLFVAERNRIWPALIDVYRAIVLYRAGRREAAAPLAARALHVFAQSPLANRAALAEVLLARLQLDAGEPASAQRSASSALARIERTEAPALRCQAHLVLGLAHEAAGDRDGAYRAYRRARLDLESMRSRLHGDDLKIAFLKDKLAVYESLVSMCLVRGTSRTRRSAFGYVEEAKSRSLADMIAFRADALPGRAADRTRALHALRESRARLTCLTRLLHESDRDAPTRTGGTARLRTHVRRERQRLGDLTERVRRQDRELAALDQAGTVSVDAIRTVLPDRAALVQYYEVRGTFHACVLTRKQLRLVPLAPVEQVRRSMRLLQLQLAKWQLGPEYLRAFGQVLEAATLAHLRNLHGALIAPIRRHLRGRHLIVVPHDVLHALPFHALHDGSRFLVDDAAVAYAPSATVYYLCATRPVVTTDRALVLGVADGRAPRIRDEVRDVAACLRRARLYTGRRASRRRLETEAPGCGVVHIATHGGFRHDNPMFSSIRLGDGELHLFELYALRLPAGLVTLSGCGTGRGVVVGADEVLGLTRGLLYAGAGAVLVSLWDVQDTTTAQLMTAFYRGMQDTPDLAVALQEAMIALKAERRHPYYWAPFLLVGRRGLHASPRR